MPEAEGRPTPAETIVSVVGAVDHQLFGSVSLAGRAKPIYLGGRGCQLQLPSLSGRVVRIVREESGLISLERLRGSPEVTIANIVLLPGQKVDLGEHQVLKINASPVVGLEVSNPSGQSVRKRDNESTGPDQSGSPAPAHATHVNAPANRAEEMTMESSRNTESIPPGQDKDQSYAPSLRVVVLVLGSLSMFYVWGAWIGDRFDSRAIGSVIGAGFGVVLGALAVLLPKRSDSPSTSKA